MATENQNDATGFWVSILADLPAHGLALQLDGTGLILPGEDVVGDAM